MLLIRLQWILRERDTPRDLLLQLPITSSKILGTPIRRSYCAKYWESWSTHKYQVVALIVARKNQFVEKNQAIRIYISVFKNYTMSSIYIFSIYYILIFFNRSFPDRTAIIRCLFESSLDLPSAKRTSYSRRFVPESLGYRCIYEGLWQRDLCKNPSRNLLARSGGAERSYRNLFQAPYGFQIQHELLHKGALPSILWKCL